MLCELYPASKSGLWPVLVSPHSLLSPDHQSVSPSRVLSILESDINGITQHVAGLGLPPLLVTLLSRLAHVVGCMGSLFSHG